ERCNSCFLCFFPTPFLQNLLQLNKVPFLMLHQKVNPLVQVDFPQVLHRHAHAIQRSLACRELIQYVEALFLLIVEGGANFFNRYVSRRLHVFGTVPGKGIRLCNGGQTIEVGIPGGTFPCSYRFSALSLPLRIMIIKKWLVSVMCSKTSRIDQPPSLGL